jgi:hypothetical protein
MELIHVKLGAAELVEVPLPISVPHRDTGLENVLEGGQDVILSDLDGEFHGAVILDVLGTPLDPVYSVRVGPRLPIDMVAERLTDLDLTEEKAGTHLVVDLLGDARSLWRARKKAEADGQVNGGREEH